MAAGNASDGLRADPGFRLLSLKGHGVKWGPGGPGTPAAIRYAFLRAPLARPGARNCSDMLPFPENLSGRAVPFSRVAAEFRAAFASWQEVAGVAFEEVADTGDADIVLGVQARPRGIAYADVAPLSKPFVLFGNGGRAAVCLNPAATWKTGFDGNERTYDIRYVAVHEIGHVIGLDHAGGPGDRSLRIMSFGYRERFRSPQPGDIAGARFLYGPPLSQPPSAMPTAGFLPVSVSVPQTRP
ncbi:MAG: matrixin family metalloprotease [Rhodospirillaceae bacterium]